MPRVTAEAQQAANVAAYRDVWATFWGNVTALQQIVIEDFPDGDNETIARYHLPISHSSPLRKTPGDAGGHAARRWNRRGKP